MFPNYSNDNNFFPNTFYISPEAYYCQPQHFNPYNFQIPQNGYYNFNMQQVTVPLIR